MSSKPVQSHAEFISSSRVKTDSFVASGIPIDSTKEWRENTSAKSSFKPASASSSAFGIPVSRDEPTASGSKGVEKKDTIDRYMTPVQTKEHYDLFVKCQLEHSAPDIILVNSPLKFPAECWFLLIREDAYNRTFYKTVQDYSVVDAILTDSVDEIVEFTKPVSDLHDKVAFQVLEIEAEDEARTRELVALLAAKFGNRFFVSEITNAKPCVWKMAICSPKAVAAKSAAKAQT